MNKTKLLIVLVLILLLATLIRVLPYATGYENLIMGDTIREYSQVMFIQENNYVNYDFIYSKYPALHLLIAETSMLTGIDSNLLFRFLPQLLTMFGCLIFFLLIYEISNSEIALSSTFLLAVFGPNILWSIKPVRETLGLFIFPLLAYLYFKANKDKTYYIPIVFVSFIALFTHHWTFLLLLILLGVFLIFSRNSNLVLMYLITFLFAFFYFYITLNPVQSFFVSISFFVIALFLFILVYIILFKFISSLDYKKVEYKIKNINLNSGILLFISILSLFMLLILVYMLKDSFVYSYSVYLLSSLILLLFFSIWGLKHGLENYPGYIIPSIITSIIYFSIIIIGIINGYNVYDPGRVAEFLIYPLGIIASIGILKPPFFNLKSSVVKNIFVSFIFLIFFVSSLFMVPTVYLTGETDSIRSYVQYIPQEGNYALEWVASNDAYLITDNTYVLALYDLLVENKNSVYLGYISNFDIMASTLEEEVNIGSIGSRIYPEHISMISSNNLLYSNGWAYIYEVSEKDYKKLYEKNPYRWFWDTNKWT